MPHDLAAAVGAAAFWMFLAIVVAVSVLGGIQGGISRHRETQKTIRQAIERGQALDPQTLERLLASARPPQPTPGARRGFLRFAGIMLLAIGGGLAAIGWFSANPNMLSQGLGAGSLVGLLGAGLLVASLFIRGDEQG
jgi:hypothetical protein